RGSSTPGSASGLPRRSSTHGLQTSPPASAWWKTCLRPERFRRGSSAQAWAAFWSCGGLPWRSWVCFQR
ncbi:Galnt12, partial [Symbiodinium sp. CCMP2456]